MKLAKGLLMGSAVAVALSAGVHAAELPARTRALAADYVKVCREGGVAGFVIPGSDVCLAISGYVSVQIAMGGPGADWKRADDVSFYRRGQLNFDVLTNTAQGPLLAHVELRAHAGDAVDWAAQETAVHSAYVQWAGFTAGKHSSFFWPGP